MQNVSNPTNLLCAAGFLAVCSLVSLSGCHGSAGPVIGRSNGSMVYGWEASGGYAWARAATGQSYRRAPVELRKRPADPNEVVTYVALEPWAYVGGTLGGAWSTQSDLGVAAGVWEGIAAPVAGCDTFTFGETRMRPNVSIGVGYRYLAGSHEFYATPKVGINECVTFF